MHVHTVYKVKKHLLVRVIDGDKVAWELRDPFDKVLMAQYEFPGMPAEPPLQWAADELKRLGIR